ncbi:MAG: beta-glucosidase [Actinomycetota bacterium]
MPTLTLADIPRLVSELTLEEKASLCSGSDSWHTQAIERLGIPAIMVADGPHGLRKQAEKTDHLGLAKAVPATCFPTAAGLGSTWDRDLLVRVGEALGRETRANGVSVLLGPGVNMKRSPLCGRNFEYFAEDPLLAGELATALVRGIQSQGVGTSLKHFAANNQETDRLRVDAQVDERTLREIYLPAFERVVRKAQPWTVMCAYNKVNGTQASEHRWLLTEVLRDEWRFEGLVVSDWGAVDDRVAGVAAGLDLEMPSSGGLNDARIVEAVRAGELDESALDAVATHVLTLVAKASPALAEPVEFDAVTHHALAREVAARTAVLLKNDGALPLPADAAGAVVIGEMARTPRYQGAGSSQVNPTRLESALEALRERAPELEFAPGYVLAEAAGQEGQERTDAELRAEAVDLARGRTAMLFLGLPAIDESEGYDRAHMDLPESHVNLLHAVRAVAAKVIVVLSNGSAVTVSGWEADADAILELWLGGQAGGAAAAQLLLGEVDPSGRLAESIPVRLVDVPAQLNFPGERGAVRYGEGLFIGYRGLDAVGVPVSHPFGYGLTYTTFAYSDLTVDAGEVTDGTEDDDVVVRVTARVTNAGGRTGVAVPQLYVGRPDSAFARALRELNGFERIELAARESRVVEFGLTRRDLAHWDVGVHGWVVEPGAVEVAVGDNSRNLPLRAVVDLAAPAVHLPLHDHSTIGEWLDHPVGGPLMQEALGDFAALVGPEAEPAFAAFVMSLPVVKVPAMIPGALPREQLDELLAQVNG